MVPTNADIHGLSCDPSMLRPLPGAPVRFWALCGQRESWVWALETCSVCHKPHDEEGCPSQTFVAEIESGHEREKREDRSRAYKKLERPLPEWKKKMVFFFTPNFTLFLRSEIFWVEWSTEFNFQPLCDSLYFKIIHAKHTSRISNCCLPFHFTFHVLCCKQTGSNEEMMCRPSTDKLNFWNKRRILE